MTPRETRETSDLEAERFRKRDALARAGYAPPSAFRGYVSAGDLRREHEAVPPGATTEALATVQGRVLGRRGHGGVVFLDVYDARGEKLQLYAAQDHLGKAAFDALELLDLGDWVGAVGKVMRTKRGELSLQLQSWVLLGKCLRPPPDPRRGVAVEARSRRPWMHFRFDDAARAKLRQRAGIKKAIRAALDRRGFVEFDTPILSRSYGGASARPFKAWCNALGEELFLSISPEPHLKEAIVGGFERVYTIARNFRNEDIDTTHNPEFEMLECYEVGSDYADMMVLCEDLLAEAARAAHGSTTFPYQGRALDLTPPFRRVSMLQAVLDHYKLAQADLAELHGRLRAEGLDPADAPSVGMACNALFEKAVQPTLWQPTFVTDYPVEISPLTRPHREHPGLVERFELFIAGTEFANAYSELNDPEEQERRLRDQDAQRRAGDEEAYPLDWDFVDAIYTGFPTTGGLGLGIDRTVMLLTDSPAIRDVVFAPLVRSAGEPSPAPPPAAGPAREPGRGA